MHVRTVQVLALIALAVPVPVLANSGSLAAAPVPPLKRTGAAVDGGLNCTACHQGAAANSDARGKLTVLAVNYTPGQKQTIKVRLEHPEAQRWGFQLTARHADVETRMAGTFSPSDSVNVRCDDGALRGAPGPCEGKLEFASHTAASSRQGTRNGVEWEVEWTAPAGSGDIVLYAAGNAANNGATNAGDNIYTTSLRISADAGCNLSAAPALRSVVNGATFQPGISMNSMVSLLGSGFAPPGARRAASGADIREGRYPAELACIAVEIAGRRVPVTYVQDDQVNVQAPTIGDTGPVTVRVIANPGRANERAGAATTVQMQEYSPAFFLYPGTNSIAARFPGGQPVASPNIAALGGLPAKPGDVITLYGTGFGATEPVFQAGELATTAAPLRDSFSITIGGTTLAREDVLYAGLSPESISGLYQFNVRIPASAPDGNVPVVIRVGSMQTQNGATIPIRRE